MNSIKNIKETETSLTNKAHSEQQSLVNICRASCRKLLTQIQRTKDILLAEFQQAFGVPEHLLHLALNEAEGLAWETEYPHLVFPTLAMEKAQGVAAWHRRQRAMARTNSVATLAAFH